MNSVYLVKVYLMDAFYIYVCFQMRKNSDKKKPEYIYIGVTFEYEVILIINNFFV